MNHLPETSPVSGQRHAVILGHIGPLNQLLKQTLAARRGERNRLLFWASLRAGELVADGDLDACTTAQALTGAATQIGLAGEDGPAGRRRHHPVRVPPRRDNGMTPLAMPPKPPKGPRNTPWLVSS
jgi:hypothetical protein